MRGMGGCIFDHGTAALRVEFGGWMYLEGWRVSGHVYCVDEEVKCITRVLVYITALARLEILELCMIDVQPYSM